ncbi:MAG TPA: L-rhamnose mutarotase [Streptosporangiaceae bacterium]|jgi:L-rhamnose mutarotase
MRIALHTRVRADRVEEYLQAHQQVPAELTDAIRAAGATSWTIWHSGTELFHVIDCDDYAGLLAQLSGNPVNQRWQERMAGLLETAHDYSGDGEQAALPVVWQL